MVKSPVLMSRILKQCFICPLQNPHAEVVMSVSRMITSAHKHAMPLGGVETSLQHSFTLGPSIPYTL